jgi:SAM-dependent methyltransferase
VKGFDISKESIELACAEFPDIDFQIMDMHYLEYDDKYFDFIYSSLTLHYSEQLDQVLAEFRRVLKPGCRAQFSVVHPIKWGAEVRRDTKDENKKSFIMGYDTSQTPIHIYGDYLNTTQVTQKPQGYPYITYWNRPISEYLHIIRKTGFNLIDFVEPAPVSEAKDTDPEYWHIYSKIPQFMIFIVEKAI